MTGARPSRMLLLLAVAALAGAAACDTEKKPLIGFEKPPPGIVLASLGGGTIVMLPIFDLPAQPGTIGQAFRPRLNGQDTVGTGGTPNFHDYDYISFYLQGWTGGFPYWLNGVPAGTYTVELVDEAGQSYGQSPPLPVPMTSVASAQAPTVIWTHYDSQMGSWAIDPTMQDGDASTDEITVTNLVGEDVIVERCLITGGARTSCTPVGTVAPQADLRTVETLAGLSGDAGASSDHQALFIHLASDASQSFQRDLVLGSYGPGNGGASCQVERIIVHGARPTNSNSPGALSQFALSSCYGYQSGPP